MGERKGNMADISNFSSLGKNDPFGNDDDEGGMGPNKGYVHIRIQQRNGRKSLTTCQGLAHDLDVKRILKAIKKNFNCNGAIVKDDGDGDVMQLQGDQRKNIFDFLTNEKICEGAEVPKQRPHPGTLTIGASLTDQDSRFLNASSAQCVCARSILTSWVSRWWWIGIRGSPSCISIVFTIPLWRHSLLHAMLLNPPFTAVFSWGERRQRYPGSRKARPGPLSWG